MRRNILLSILLIFLFFPSTSMAQIKQDVFKKVVLHIPPQKFFLTKHHPIKFVPFDRSFFRIPKTQNTVKLKNGKTLTVEEFLKEANELEKKLNKLGYTLRNKEPIKIKYIYPGEVFRLQKEGLLKETIKKATTPLSPQVICDGYSEEQSSSSGRPKDFVPLNWERKWDASFGNDDFGLDLISSLKIMGDDNSLDIEPLFNTRISLLGLKENVLRLYRNGNTLIGESQGKVFFKQPLHGFSAQNFHHNFDFSNEIEISILDLFKITGNLGINGYIDIKSTADYKPSLAKENLNLRVFAKTIGNFEADIKIVSLHVDANLVIIDYNPKLDANIMLKSSPRYFELSADGITDEGKILKGRLAIYGEIDALMFSKDFEVELFEFDGYPLNIPNFSYHASIPAEKDHHLYLRINSIRGITPYTRNEKLDIEPLSFDLIVNIDGRVYTKTLKDYNKDGIYGNAIGEYEYPVFEIPLLSFKKVPISIEVMESYKIGTLAFKNTLDLSPGIGKKVELCYDPKTRTFTGTASGSENKEIRLTGDSNYWGERNHLIVFELTTEGGFRSAPAKAK